jgi:hypothetical protein
MKIIFYLSFILIPAFVFIAFAMRAGVMVATEAVDDSGSVIIGSDGHPVLTISRWHTWWANWPSNISLIIASLLALYSIIYAMRYIANIIRPSCIRRL